MICDCQPDFAYQVGSNGYVVESMSLNTIKVSMAARTFQSPKQQNFNILIFQVRCIVSFINIFHLTFPSLLQSTHNQIHTFAVSNYFMPELALCITQFLHTPKLRKWKRLILACAHVSNGNSLQKINNKINGKFPFIVSTCQKYQLQPS